MISQTSYVVTVAGPKLASELKTDDILIYLLKSENSNYLYYENPITLIEVKKKQKCRQVNDLVVTDKTLVGIGDNTFVPANECQDLFNISTLNDPAKISKVYINEFVDIQDVVEIKSQYSMMLVGPTVNGPFHLVMESK